MAKPADTKTAAAGGAQGTTRGGESSGAAVADSAPGAGATTSARSATKTAAKDAPAKSAAAKRGAAGKSASAAKTASKTAKGTAAKKPAAAGARAAAVAKSGSVTATEKGAAAGGGAGSGARPKRSRSAAETERIRGALEERREDLRREYDQHLAEIAELQRDRLTDSAGDDQADTGSKTFEREQEISLANSILERITQVERALERLAEGSYGWCERCGSAIPVERLAAFPSATLCVRCKQLEERR